MNENVNVSNEIAVVSKEDLYTGITPAELMNPATSQMFCTLVDDGTPKSKAKIYNAINNPDKKLSDVIGETIELKDIVAHMIELVDEETGEYLQTLRTVLIDSKGVSYEAVSGGVANAVSRLIQIYGQPNTWTEPVKVKARQKATRNGNNKVTTLEVVL